MAWQIRDRQLASEARRIARVVSLVAWLAASAALVGVSLGFFFSSYQNDRHDVLSDVARIQGEVDAILRQGATAASNTLSTQQQILLDARRHDSKDENPSDERYAIYDASGYLITALGSPPPGPILRIERPLAADGAGFVAVEKSLRPTLYHSGFVVVLAALLAASILVALRLLPMRAFYRAMERLDKMQAAHAEAESGLRAHVLELEKAQAALQESTAHLQMALENAAESSQAKSQFLASMSHELRTPLNAIIGFSEIIENQLFGPIGNERYGEYVNLILSSGKHLLALVNEILDLSKAGAGRLELFDGEVDLALLVRDLLRTMQTTAERSDVQLISGVADSLLHLRADPQRMTQILLNLISNAIKFNVAKGMVRIDAECKPADGMKITVADSGIGIAAENIPKALERFGQVEDSLTKRYQGTGLGLPISKKLVELHGGTLMIKSAVGEGTCVTIWLPPERVLDSAASGFEFELSHEI